MAKSHPVQLAPGLTLEGEDILTATTHTPLAAVVARAARDLRKEGQLAQADEVAACKMHASAWGALLALDPEVAALTRETEPRAVVLVLVGAATRAVLAPADPCALVLAVGEAVRLHTLATLPKNRVRLRGLLAEPCTVEAAVWEADLLRFKDHVPTGQPSTFAHRDARLQAHADACASCDAHNAKRDRILEAAARGASTGLVPPPAQIHPVAPVFLPAVRLRGGLCGPRGVLLRPGGDSALAWAAVAWRISCAALGAPRKVAAPSKSGKTAALGLPAVVSLDGVVLRAANLSPADLAEVLRINVSDPSTRVAATEQADAFVAQATKARDEAYKVPGEDTYLAQIAAGELSEYTLTELERTAARQLATTLTAPGADLRSPAFDRVRDDVRIALKRPQRSKHRSNLDHLVMWAEALAAEVGRADKLRTCSTRISARQNNRRAA